MKTKHRRETPPHTHRSHPFRPGLVRAPSPAASRYTAILSLVSIGTIATAACSGQGQDSASTGDTNDLTPPSLTPPSTAVAPRMYAPMPTCKAVLEGPGIAAYCGNANATIYESNGACWCSGGGDGGAPDCGEQGCKNPSPACACGAGKSCNAVGVCEACVPKTCADFPGQCSNGPVAITPDGGGAGGAPVIADGCGGALACPCATPGDVCTAGGICAPPACTATNQPKGPAGISFRPPGINFEQEVPKPWATYLCKIPTAMGLPALSDKAKIKFDAAGGKDSKGLPVCLSKDSFDIKISGEAELCGWIFGLKGSYNDSTETLYCPYCDLADNTNKCTSDWGRQSEASRFRLTGEFGPKIEISAADMVMWLFDAMKYKKTGTGEEVYVLKQLPFYSRMKSFLESNKKSIDDLAKFKAELKVSQNFTRARDTIKRGTAKCSSALNCDSSTTTLGPGIGAGISLEVNLPPKGTGIGGFIGDIFSINIEEKLSANGNVQYGLRLQDGECGKKNCVDVNAFGNVGATVRIGARLKGVRKVRGTFDMTCVGQVGFEACDDLTAGPTPPEGKCKVNAFISTE